MPKMTFQTLGRKLAEKREDRGIRDVAKEIGISPATLSRIERGHIPDLETFGKICRWLNVDPAGVLGVKPQVTAIPKASAHFRKDKVLKPSTAEALAQLILAAQRALMVSGERGE